VTPRFDAILPDADAQGVINAGPSRRGWSRISAAFHCYQRYAWEHVLGFGEHWGAPGPTRGSLGHVGLAQIHARWMAYQVGEDPDRYATWSAAMEAWCRAEPRGWEWIDHMKRVVEQYLDKNPSPIGRRILGVEHQYAAVLGWKDGEWHPGTGSGAQNFGLWLLRTDAADMISDIESGGGFCREDALPHWNGGTIRAAKLDCPGHRAHGRVLDISRRLDLEFENVDGQVWIADHKCVPGTATIVDADRGRVTVERLLRELPEGATWRCVARGPDGELATANASRPWNAGTRVVHELRLKNGMTARYGEDHPVLTEALRWVETRDLLPGTKVAVALEMPDRPEMLVPDAALTVIGALTADGCLTAPHIDMGKAHPTVIEHYCAALTALGLVEDPDVLVGRVPLEQRMRRFTRLSKRTFTVIRVGANSLLHAWLVDWQVPKVRGAEKTLPPLADFISKRQAGILLGALWDGDGSAYLSNDRTRGCSRFRTCLTYATSSVALAADVQRLLLYLGIPAILNTYSSIYRGSPRAYHQVTVVGNGRGRFLSMVLSGAIDAPATRQGGFVSRRGNSTPPAAVLLEHSRDTVEIVDQPVWWVEVRSNTAQAPESVYHIAVPELHNFVADGLVTHNCLARVSESTKKVYAMDGQFACARAMGFQRYGAAWGGTMLNAVQTMGSSYKQLREPLPPVPWADRTFPSDILYREQEVARLELRAPDGWNWPRQRTELGCVSRYGECEGMGLCWGGPAARDG